MTSEFEYMSIEILHTETQRMKWEKMEWSIQVLWDNIKCSHTLVTRIVRKHIIEEIFGEIRVENFSKSMKILTAVPKFQKIRSKVITNIHTQTHICKHS